MKNKFKINDEIEIPIKFISKRLKIKVDVLCDVCHKEFKINYNNYNDCLGYGFYSCNKCKHVKIKMTCLEKYGDETYKDIYKMKKTKLEKYGDENFTNREKAKNTCLERYGKENVSCVDFVKEIKKQTNIKNWGVENVFQSEIIKDKNKKHHLKNLGVDHPSKSEYIKNKKIETCNKNLGVDYPTQSKQTIDKAKITCLEKYGVDWYTKTEEYKENIIKFNIDNFGEKWYMLSNDFKNKSKITNNKKYGFDYAQQNYEVFQKQQKSGFKAKKYNNLYYRGTYELDFLKFCECNNIEVMNGYPIKFIYNYKNKVYYPDFYLPKFNIICEIKSLYYYNKYLDLNLIKKNACELLGFKFLFIIDKKYNNLLEIIKIV